MSVLAKFEAIAAAWPLVPARAGRDLGEYIRGTYAKRFREMAVSGNMSQVAIYMLALK